VTQNPQIVTDVEVATALAAEQVLQAFDQNTFSVGGVLLDNKGNLIHALHNNVVKNGTTFDPTAHGERQMIDWYFEQISQGVQLPPPGEMTVVTSLDPCCMCAGSILHTGFNVTVAAFDTQSGINYDTKADFPSLAPTVQAKAKSTFSYPAVNGKTSFARPASGAPLPKFFAQPVIDEQTQALCLTSFLATLGSVRGSVSQDLPPNELIDPKTLLPNDPIIQGLQKIYPQALQYKAPARSAPDQELLPYLTKAAALDRQQGGPGQAVALLDYFGNLIFCLPGNIAASPIQTAFMLTTRSYAFLRYSLKQQKQIDDRVYKYLGHPKYGTFVFLLGPDDSAASLIDLGAYGSTMEGPLPPDNPNQFQYWNASMDPAALSAYCAKLPPLYSGVIKVNPVQVAVAAKPA
jgi:tRNA(Arg) A34 adenosine deaminase TadA